MSKIECYQCHKKGHYKSDFPNTSKNKKRDRDHANFSEEGDPKKAMPEESDIRDLQY